MLDFEEELLSHLIGAATIAKADGFLNTAAAMLAVAEDMRKAIAARSTTANHPSFLATGTKVTSPSLSLSEH